MKRISNKDNTLLSQNLKIKNQQSIKKNREKIKLLCKEWRFWTKLLIGILPIISIIIFTAVTLSTTLWFKHNGIFPNNWSPKYSTTLQELQSWSDISVTFMVIFRNLTLYTSYSTFIFSGFFLNSAFNTLKEGQGRYDNSYVGLLSIVIISFTLFFYNISLPITGDFKTWLGVQWMSMFFQHSLIPLLGIIYYFAFYQHSIISHDKNKMLRWWGYTLAAILGYFIFFTIFGYILKATHGWKPMPDMSFSGYFPYDFMEFTNPRASYTNGRLPMQAQTVIIYIVFALITSGFYFGYYFAQLKIIKKQYNKKLFLKPQN